MLQNLNEYSSKLFVVLLPQRLPQLFVQEPISCAVGRGYNTTDTHCNRAPTVRMFTSMN